MTLFQILKSFFAKKENYDSETPINSSIYDIKKNVWSNDELRDFREKLSQVIAWTEKLSENFDFENDLYGSIFRQTNPELNEKKLYTFENDYTTWTDYDYSFEKFDIFLDLALKQRPISKQIDFSKIGELGRILSFATCLTTHDGAPIIESKGFVDESDVPPIDTWFYLKRDYIHKDCAFEQSLFCWIPKRFEKVMQQAIDVEIFDSYCWLDENDKDVYEQIKNSK